MKFIKTLRGNHMFRRKLDGLVLYACLLAVFATTLLAAIYYFYIPLRIDGGWYSYPALCLSEGRDPGENYLKPNDVKDQRGIKAIFDIGDDFRRSIRVIPMTLWFKALGTSIWIVKLFGILEYYILLAIMYLVLRKICRDRNVLLLCFAIFLLDSPPIWYASTNVRPDVFMAALTLSIFLLAQIDETTKHQMVIFFAGVVLMFFLPLIRISAAISLVFLLSYLIIELSLSWHDLSGFKKWFYMSLIAAGTIGYLLRDHLLDLIISTRYPSQLPFHMDGKAFSVLKQRSPVRTLLKELVRWEGYFRLSNVGSLIAVLVAFGLFLARSFFPGDKTPKRQDMGIVLSCMIGVAALAIFDPTPLAGHLIPLMAVFILLLARELELISFRRMRKLVIPLLLLIVLASTGIRFAQGIKVAAKGIKNGYSNAALTEAIGGVFKPGGKNYVLFGPTELWPYFDPRSNVLMVDFRYKWSMSRLSDGIKSVDYIIVEKSYLELDWENNFLSRYPGIKLSTVCNVGNPNSGWYFLKVIKASFSE